MFEGHAALVESLTNLSSSSLSPSTRSVSGQAYGREGDSARKEREQGGGDGSAGGNEKGRWDEEEPFFLYLEGLVQQADEERAESVRF